MAKYILRRVAISIITLLLIVILLFLLERLMPGTPFNDEKLKPEQIEILYAKYGLDKPMWQQILIYIGNGRLIHFFSDKFAKQTQNKVHLEEVEAVREACQEMAETKTGALIIFARQTPLDDYLSTGETIDAKPSAELLENIFFKNSPLHDGAVIIKNHRIAAARCILPVSKNKNLPQEVGLRHRSALGATEFTDAIAVVVSEQTGNISICRNGTMTRDLTSSSLRQMLEEILTKE